MYLCQFDQNPSTGSEDNAQKPYFGHFKVCQIIPLLPTINLPLFPTMYICKFGQNLSAGSEDNAWKRKSRRQRRRDPHQK